MSEKSSIEWTDATFNPWWGCTKVSPGCDHCYAERDAARFTPGHVLWGADSERRTFGDKHWNEPLKWDRKAAATGKRVRVFCASMADVFDKDAPEGARERLWALIESTPNLDWQILTKRVGNVARMVPAEWMRRGFPGNVWLGISVVNQEEADRDIPKLLVLPACIRWLSCEPLLGPIDLESIAVPDSEAGKYAGHGYTFNALRRIADMNLFDAPAHIDWVVVGGESGSKARPMHPGWARGIRDQCLESGVAFLFKQWGEYLPHLMATDQPHKTNWSPPGARIGDQGFVRIGKRAAGRLLDERVWDGYPA